MIFSYDFVQNAQNERRIPVYFKRSCRVDFVPTQIITISTGHTPSGTGNSSMIIIITDRIFIILFHPVERVETSSLKRSDNASRRFPKRPLALITTFYLLRSVV